MNWKLFLENVKIAIMKRSLAKRSVIISDRSTNNRNQSSKKLFKFSYTLFQKKKYLMKEVRENWNNVYVLNIF